MKCLDCGMEMEKGIVEGVGQGGEHFYEFTSDEEMKKTGLKGILTAWHCPNCKKVLMWMDSKE